MPIVPTLLRIKNLALVEQLDSPMAPGFIAVTGQTGAGKSIIIGALQLLLDERADPNAASRERTRKRAVACPGPEARLKPCLQPD